MTTHKEYLGDGVYVDYDGYRIVLTTEGGIRANTIYLEDNVYDALVSYVNKLQKRLVENELTDA